MSNIPQFNSGSNAFQPPIYPANPMPFTRFDMPSSGSFSSPYPSVPPMPSFSGSSFDFTSHHLSPSLSSPPLTNRVTPLTSGFSQPQVRFDWTPQLPLPSYTSSSLANRMTSLPPPNALQGTSFDRSSFTYHSSPLSSGRVGPMTSMSLTTNGSFDLLSHTSLPPHLSPQLYDRSINMPSVQRPSFDRLAQPSLPKYTSSSLSDVMTHMPSHSIARTTSSLMPFDRSSVAQISGAALSSSEFVFAWKTGPVMPLTSFTIQGGGVPQNPSNNIPFQRLPSVSGAQSFSESSSSWDDFSISPSTIAVLAKFDEMLTRKFSKISPFDNHLSYTRDERMYGAFALSVDRTYRINQVSLETMFQPIVGDGNTQSLVPFGSVQGNNLYAGESSRAHDQMAVFHHSNLSQISGRIDALQPFASMPMIGCMVLGRTMEEHRIVHLKSLADHSFSRPEGALQFPLESGALGATFFNPEDIFLGTITNSCVGAYRVGKGTWSFVSLFRSKPVIRHVEVQLLKIETALAKQYCLNEMAKMPVNVDVRLLKLSEDTFRKNLVRYTGINPGKVAHAHHVLPKEFERRFGEIGINVHDPKLGSWWEVKDHLGNAWEYNQVWVRFLDDKRTNKEIFNHALKMAERYNFKTNL